MSSLKITITSILVLPVFFVYSFYPKSNVFDSITYMYVPFYKFLKSEADDSAEEYDDGSDDNCEIDEKDFEDVWELEEEPESELF